MSMRLFGSRAILHYFPDYPIREDADTDWLVRNPKEIPKRKGHEHFWCDAMEYLDQHNKSLCIVEPNFLYTIKVSHQPWELKNGSWWKHMKDIVFLEQKGCKLVEPFHELLIKDWEILHGSKKHIQLNKPVEEFFTSKVQRFMDHDKLHELFMLSDVPAYTRITPDKNYASCSKELFLSLTKEQRLHTILEEVFVTAAERGLPFSSGYKYLITKLSKGWWNTYALCNASALLNGFKQEKLDWSNKVKELKGSVVT